MATLEKQHTSTNKASFYLLGAQQLSQSKVINASVVGDDGQVLALVGAKLEGANQVLGDTAQSKASDHEGRARGNVLDGLLGRGIDLAQVLDVVLAGLLVGAAVGRELAAKSGEGGDGDLLKE